MLISAKTKEVMYANREMLELLKLGERNVGESSFQNVLENRVKLFRKKA
jgi:GTP-binding protein EngB required for normal cell division